MAEKFGKIRLAALLSLDAAMTKFAERVAVARGAAVLVTKDPDEAQRWLRGDRS
jgi:L-lactate utilization protein LutB